MWVARIGIYNLYRPPMLTLHPHRSLGFDKVEEPYMDFERARQRAALNRLLGTILARSNSLTSLAEAKQGYAFAGQARSRLQQVHLARIVGSVNRTRDFDRNFNPLTNVTRQRWERVNQAFRDGVLLPPVSLQKLGDNYYVKDGHHRISVARHHGATFIDAEVTEFVCATEMAA